MPQGRPCMSPPQIRIDMVQRLELFFKALRSWLSRSEWGIRFLRLAQSTGTETDPGLLLIQIDGLSRHQLETALHRNEMPFLNHLAQKEGYHLHTLYSGQPASTPAFQGEFFYGIKGAVPAFSFRVRETGKAVRMFDPEAAKSTQKSLEKNGSGLLAGGSSYADIFTGGAAESHFCPSEFGWGHLIKGVNPLALTTLILSHGISLARTLVLFVLECFLAVRDCAHGFFKRRDLWAEIKFIPLRVTISILLRDLAVIGAKMDVTRGLPIVHLNLLGYDEQAHRRGPSSDFAHWTLKGIDRAIKGLFHTAHRSSRRDYDVWVYSDHGQEGTIPYQMENGRTLQEAVAKIFSQDELTLYPSETRYGVQHERSKWLGGSIPNRIPPERDKNSHSAYPVVTAMGSLGHLYLEQHPEPEVLDAIARELILTAQVPLVLAPAEPRTAYAWTAEGKFQLPGDAAKILGPNHPFLEETAKDLVALCHHTDAGHFILSGWRMGRLPVSFPMENGSHTGPGPEETRAFALLPITAPIKYREDREYLRPLDLREGVLHALGRHPSPQKPHFRPTRKDTQRIRIMTYNVHSCMGMDGKLSPERAARVIAHYDPDIVALQELDVNRSRTGATDQAHLIAKKLEMEFHFFPALQLAEEQYGDAILSRHPMRLVHAGPLPGLPGKPHLEPRGALWVAITLGDTEIQLFNTHLGLRSREKRIQVEALMGTEWLAHPDCRAPVIVCGDFNALPRSRVCRKMRRRFLDAQLTLRDHRPQRTFFGRYPLGRIDHVFVSPDITVCGVEVPRTALTRMVSDHLPLIVEINIPERA